MAELNKKELRRKGKMYDISEVKTKRIDVDLESGKIKYHQKGTKQIMDKNTVIEKLSWITQSQLAPQPITQEYKERQYRFFENYVHFLQDNGFTTREILRTGEKSNDDSKILVGDLTEEGLKFYIFGIRKWREKYDRAKDKDKAINDFAFIEKKLKEFEEKENKLNAH